MYTSILVFPRATASKHPRHKYLANAKSQEHELQIFIYRWYHVYMVPRSYSVLGNTRMLNKLTKVSHTFQLFIHATKITNFWLQQHNHFLECWICIFVSSPKLIQHVNNQTNFNKMAHFGVNLWSEANRSESHFGLDNSMIWVLNISACTKNQSSNLLRHFTAYKLLIYTHWQTVGSHRNGNVFTLCRMS